MKELPGAFINTAGKLDVSRVETEKLFGVTETGNGIAEAQNNVNKALAQETSSLKEQMMLLNEKEWIVNVTAPGATSVSGDILGGVQ
jgi:hypothetical protein